MPFPAPAPARASTPRLPRRPGPRVPPTYAPTPQLAQLMSTPAVRPVRARHAYQLPAATYYSKDDNMREPQWLIEQLTSVPELWDDLERETTEPHSYEKLTTGRKSTVGRDRMPGSWLLISLAWMLSKQVDIQTWYDTNKQSPIWASAGFDRLPSRQTTWLRLTELLHFLQGIADSRRKLWHLAAHCDSRVGRHIHIDATFYESHTRLHHACTDPLACKANGGGPEWITRQDGRTADTLRQEENKLPPGETLEHRLDVETTAEVDPVEAEYEAALDALDALEVSDDDLLDADGDPLTHPKLERYALADHRPEPREVFIRCSKGATYKHRYIARDGDAGFRIYGDKKRGGKKTGCFGGLTLRATDDYTGEEIASVHLRADEAEFQHFERLLNRVREMLGFDPEVIVADGGHAVRDIHRLCIARGIALMTPFRRSFHVTEPADLRQEGIVDEYGIPYCKHCGSIGTTRGSGLGFEQRGERQYVRFRCANPHTPSCKKQVQRIDCEVEPLLLGPLSREQELYWELHYASMEKERAHALARSRCNLDGRIAQTRPKRIGIDFVELRGELAVVPEDVGSSGPP